MSDPFVPNFDSNESLMPKTRACPRPRLTSSGFGHASSGFGYHSVCCTATPSPRYSL